MGPSSVLLFDLGGVLVHTRGFASIKHLLAASGRPEAFDDQLLRDRWLSSPSVRDFELGRSTAAEFATRFVSEWQLPVSPDTLLEDLAGWIERPYPGAEDLLDSLRQEHYVCCFSNCNELHWEVMAPFLQHFDEAFSSHLLGQIKPDEAAFMAVLRTLDVEPAAVRFFDDSRANIEGAERLGIRSFLVHEVGGVKQALQEEGLL